jgi:hypothetical protein
MSVFVFSFFFVHGIVHFATILCASTTGITFWQETLVSHTICSHCRPQLTSLAPLTLHRTGPQRYLFRSS